MATFVFDGTSNITATKSDTVVITANPALFTSVADVGGNSSVFNFGGRTLTITGTTFGPNATNFPNVSLAGGTFSTSASAGIAPATANDLIIAPTAGINAAIDVSNADASAAGNIRAVFGGLGVADPIDGADSIVIGGKGSFLVYGNAGADKVTQTGALDSQSFATVFGGKDNDSVTLTTAANAAKMAIYGGEGSDSLNIVNGGTNANTIIFGGQGAADATDLADSIDFNGGGTVQIFGNAGSDTINLGNTQVGTVTGLATGTNATIHGGKDADTITIAVNTATKSTATIVVYGDENNAGAGNEDVISVTGNAGTTVIYGGTAAADAADGADKITYSGQGTATIYAAGGDDTITLNGAGATTLDSTSTTTVFAGNGNDSVFINKSAIAAGITNITLGAGADSVTIGSTADTNYVPGVVISQGSAAGAGTTESAALTFKALATGESVTVAGLTYTATADLSATQVATAFGNTAANATTNAAGTANGTYSGTLTGFGIGASTGATATATSSTTNTNVTDIVVTGTTNSAGSGNGITVSDFTVGNGGDKLVVQNGIGTANVAGTGTVTIVDASSAQTQQAALDLAVSANSAAKGSVAAILFQGAAYVVVNNDANATFNAATDLAIKLTGVTDLAALSTATQIV